MFFPKPPKLLFIQPTTFPPQKQTLRLSKFRTYTWLSNLPTPCFRISSSTKPPKPHSRGNSQNIRLPCQTPKKYLSLSCSAPIARLFETIMVDTGQKRARDITCAPNGWYQQTSAKTDMPSISTQNRFHNASNIHNFTNMKTCPKSPSYRHAKVYAHSSDKPLMFEIPDLGLKS